MLHMDSTIGLKFQKKNITDKLRVNGIVMGFSEASRIIEKQVVLVDAEGLDALSNLSS